MKKINNETKETKNQTTTQVKIKWEKPRRVKLGRNKKTQGKPSSCPSFGSNVDS